MIFLNLKYSKHKINKIQININATQIYIFFLSLKFSTFLRELRVCNFLLIIKYTAKTFCYAT